MQKKWLIKDAPDSVAVTQLQQDLGVSRIVAEMLVQRGITEFEAAKAFFRPSLDDLHDPFLMKDMENAVARLQKAHKKQEKVLIYGDYDVDGTTAVALVYGCLKEFFREIEYYIPDRYKEGYGVSEAGVRYANENGLDLIITLDCGIKAHKVVDLGNEFGIDFIICDHHTPGDELPKAIVLDPKRSDCEYPYKELSGAGVGFKLLSAFFDKEKLDQKILHEQLDLLAISIGADIVPITGENRVLCALGLELLNKKPRLGIGKLLKFAKKERPLTLTNVVFIIAPRINAAGRMGDAKNAVELLLTTDSVAGKQMAKEIHESNEVRRGIDETITEEALAQIEASPDHAEMCTNVVFEKGWHKGVIGIVASRIIETHYKPTIVFTQTEEGAPLTGSVRSVKGVNIYDVLNECEDLIEQFGGHYYAAGLSISPENFPAFKAKFNEVVANTIGNETLIPEQILEGALTFDEIFPIGEQLSGVPRIKRILSQFEPHGPGNMKPVFISHNVYAKDARLLKGAHLKLRLYQPDCRATIDAILFNRPDAYELAISGQPLSVAYTMEINEWQGRSSLQLMLKDIRPEAVLVS